jgi:GTPase SAR1 family protein
MATMSTVRVLFIGNKIDLADQRQVTTEEATNFAKENNLFYYETSSKTN